MSRLLHLNGASGVGKSTVASAWVAQHPGAQLVDIDLLRTGVPGWESDFVGTGRRLRSGVITRIIEVLRDGGEVVLPQLVMSESELDRFERTAVDAGATYECVVLTVPEGELLRRLRDRPVTPVVAQVNEVIARLGGESHVCRLQSQLEEVAARRGFRVVDASTVDEAVAQIEAARPTT